MSQQSKPLVAGIVLLGWTALLLAALLNEFTLGPLLSSDGHIQPQNMFLLRLADLFFLLVGLTFVLFPKWIAHRVKELLLLFTTVVVCVILAEGILRVIERPSEAKMYQPNPHGTGSYRHKPNFSMKFSMDAEFIVKTNSHGMPWREVSVDKPAGKRRLAFVGDSFTMGWLAQRVEDSIVGIVDSRLSNEKIEVLNFGVGGYGTTDEELLIREEVLKFHPDTIVLMYFNGNDFKDVYLGLNKVVIRDGTLQRPPLIVAQISDANKKSSTNVPLTSTITRAIDSFILNLKIYQRYDSLVGKESSQARASRAPVENFEPGQDFTSYMYWSQKKYPDIAEKAKQLSLESFSRIKKMCDGSGVELIVIAIPFLEQVYAAHEEGESYDIQIPQKYIREFSVGNKIAYFDLLPFLRNYVKTNNNVRLYFEEGHFNSLGYAVAGGAVAEFLSKNGI